MKVAENRQFDYFGGRILLYDDSDSFYGCNIRMQMLTFNPGSFIPPGLIQGSNMVITRRLFETIGFFDPVLGAGALFRFEDIDYVARASLAGFSGCHCPDLVMYHHHGRKKRSNALKKLALENFQAAGSYHMKTLLMGNRNSVSLWLKDFSFRSYRMHLYQLIGALKYFCYCLWKRKFPTIKITIDNIPGNRKYRMASVAR